MICYNPPSQIVWFTFPVILSVFCLRFFFAGGAWNAMRREKGHGHSSRAVKWAVMLHSSSVITVLSWLAYEIVTVTTICQLSCTGFHVRIRYACWTFANFTQNVFYSLKWVAITSNGSSQTFVIGKFDKPVLVCAGILTAVNCAIAVYMMTAFKVDTESTCDVEERAKILISLYAVLDIMVGVLFLGVFLNPVLKNRRSVNIEEEMEASVVSIVRATTQELDKVIKGNLGGAAAAQLAQTSAVLVAGATSYAFQAHAIRVTTCLNVVGLSLMFRDAQRVMGKIVKNNTRRRAGKGGQNASSSCQKGAQKINRIYSASSAAETNIENYDMEKKSRVAASQSPIAIVPARQRFGRPDISTYM